MDEQDWIRAVGARKVYHASPLHYLPRLLSDGELRAKAFTNVQPRATAVRRDRMLCLSEYIHFSWEPMSPLLRHKLSRGYRHVVFEFAAINLLNCDHALLPFNTKAWHSKADYCPVVETVDKIRLLDRFDRGRHPSLEFLVHRSLSLRICDRVHVCSEEESELVRRLLAKIEPECSVDIACSWSMRREFRIGDDSTASLAYLYRCLEKGEWPVIPAIRFD